MFCDQTTLVLHAGDGGNGCLSFRREKFVPRGGPDGGDGGKGGDIYFKVNHALNTLTHLDTYKQFRAEAGEMGKGQQRHGKNAEDLILEVPLGTLVLEIVRDKKGKILKKSTIADLSKLNQVLLVAKGGRGGYGNSHFKSSVRRAPKFAELGEEGETVEVELELKLVADVGIIGIPSAGKSTLISVVSNAKPKIADYPFTTLVPNLGVVKISTKKTYVVADIPGLIENAHLGKGLGIQFLKHVQRCRLLVHLVDPSQGSVLENFRIINQELASFSPDLATKKQIVVINKADLVSDEEVQELINIFVQEVKNESRFELYPTPISAATTRGVAELKKFLFQELSQSVGQPVSPPSSSEGASEDRQTDRPKDHILYRPHLEDPKYFSVEKLNEHSYLVTGQRIGQIVNMTNFENPEAVRRIHDVLKKMGIRKELRKMGAEDGDRVKIGKHEFELESE